MAGVSGDALTICTAGFSTAHRSSVQPALALATFGYILNTEVYTPKYTDRADALLIEQYRKDLING